MSLLKKTEFTFQPEQDTSFLVHLPKMESLAYLGISDSKVVSFRSSREGEGQLLFFLTVIAQDECERWKSMQEMLTQSTKSAALQIQGLFSFELFSVNLLEGIRAFDFNRFASLLVNHAKKLSPGEQVLVRYCGCYGVLSKKMNEDWGKVDFKHAVQVHTKSREQLDLKVKKIAKLKESAVNSSEAFTFMTLVDLSEEPLFRFGDDAQTERMQKTLTRIKKESDNLEIYYLNKNSAIQLFEQFNL